MGMSPFDFYNLTYKEARLILEGYEEEQKQLYYYNYYATLNALGPMLGGKKFKPIDPFVSNQKKRKKVTDEDRQELINLFKQHEKDIKKVV